MTRGIKKITIELATETVIYLQALAGDGAPTLEDVIEHLAHSAAAGIRRPAAWERRWLMQAFGDDWEAKCEQVPGVEYAQLRPMLRVESGELRRLPEKLAAKVAAIDAAAFEQEQVCETCGRRWYPSKNESASFPGSDCDRRECLCSLCELDEGQCSRHAPKRA